MHSSSSNTFTRISAANVDTFKSVCAHAKDGMSIDEINHLVSNLIDIRAAKEAATSAKARRLERMAAAKSNPKYGDVIRQVNARLERLGVGNIDRVAKSGNLAKLNDAMKAAAMRDEDRFELKANAAWLGLID